MNSILLKYIPAIISVLFFFTSCEKDPADIVPEPEPALSYLSAVNSTNEVFLTFLFYNPSDLTSPEQYENVTINVTPLYPLDSFPKIVTINFDDSGVLCPDSVIRKGKMICRLNSPWNVLPSKSDITFENFYFDDNKIDGLFSFSSEQLNDSIYIDYNILNGIVTKGNSDSVTFNMNMTICTTSIRNERSLNPFSWHSCKLNNFSGSDFNDKPFGVSISKQIFFDNLCNNGELTAGEIHITPDASTDFSANFGNGECDHSITIIFNGNSIPVSF